MNRRDFLHFLGASGVIVSLPDNLKAVTSKNIGSLPHLKASTADQLETLEGLNYKVLLRWGDQINKTEKFGFNNDFIAFHPISENRGILWVNHEYVSPLFTGGLKRDKNGIDQEMKEVGGSLVEIKKINNEWLPDLNSPYNRRLDANTQIPFAWPQEIQGSKYALGTMGNCAGGYTPWGTILTCEENYDMFWGEKLRNGTTKNSWLGWEKYYPRPPQHYGWVVEVEPLTGKSKKLISLGRCAHECAAVTKSQSGHIVAYTGDDCNDEHLYKFISDSKDSLEKGKLYVANLEKGEWISLSIEDQPILKSKFKDQTEILIYVREAAKLVGATPLARPEDIEFDPLTGNVLVALTNNKPRGNYYGSILKIMENQNDHGSLKFKHEVFLPGGKEHGFASPDNMVFDPKGNLWFTTDMAGKEINQGEYAGFGNNSLFVFLRTGKHAGKVIRVANAPVQAELTGPCFSPDYKTLFLSVQHPGEESSSMEHLTSNWPDGGIPKPSVITLQGPLLNQIVEGKL
jgi:secreted PhoX family phosphatase